MAAPDEGQQQQQQCVVVPSQWKVGAVLDRVRFPQYGGDWDAVMAAVHGEPYWPSMPRSHSPLSTEELARKCSYSCSCSFTSQLTLSPALGRTRATEGRVRPRRAGTASAADHAHDADNPNDPGDGRLGQGQGQRHEDSGVLTDDRAAHPRHGGPERARPPAERGAPERAPAVQARRRRGVCVLQAAQDRVRGPEGERRGAAVRVSVLASLAFVSLFVVCPRPSLYVSPPPLPTPGVPSRARERFPGPQLPMA